MHRTAWVGLIATVLVLMLALPAWGQAEEPLRPETVHIVQHGETLGGIAERHGVASETIAHLNGIADPRAIYVGQRILIPEGAVSAQIETTPYVVQAGDTLVSLARRFRTTWQRLSQINGLVSPASIYAGQVIQRPSMESALVIGEVTSPALTGRPYVVHPGETIHRIALRHGVSPWALAASSRIANPALIYPGQELVIPGEGQGSLPDPFVSLDVQPLPVAQGEVLVIAVRTSEPVDLSGQVLGRQLQFGFSEPSSEYYGLVGVHVFTEPGLYELTLSATDGAGDVTVLTTEVVVRDGQFSYERIDLPDNRTSLLDPNVNADELAYLMQHLVFTPERHWSMPFQQPCVGTISAYYGTHRAYEGGPYTSYHTGVDFRAPSGTPVHAASAGTVVLAEPLTVRGNTVVIDHGWGVFTGYWHLSSLEVEVGQVVGPGDLIARVGNTGLSTGAHLHWEVWAGGISVNGLQWLDDSPAWPDGDWLAKGG